ncbi:MAG: sensor histidine kinase, partial [Kofleriaceae bacterium]
MPSRDRLHGLIVLGIAAAWWCLVALVSAANQVVQHGDPWLEGIADGLVASSLWIPLTVAVFALSRRVPLRRAGWPRRLAIHLGAAAAIVALRAAFIYSLDPWLHWYSEPPAFGEVLLHSVQNNLFLYFLITGVAHAVIYAREAIARARREAELSAALGRAELAALAATLHPHFLFNTLQAIAEMVHRDVEAADRMIVQLSAMLRRLLDDRRALVPLRDELAFVADYLALEQVRFGDLLAVRWDIAAEVGDVPIPRLSIQPLAENALRHGLWPAGRPGTLAIVARREGDELVVSVTDDGLGLGGAATAGSGLGLATVRARIDRMYPGRGEVAGAARRDARDGVEARVV